MFLAMIKRALKATLHEGTEEWAVEIGIPRASVVQQRTNRLALDAEARDRADDRAAAALGIEDDLADATQTVLRLLASGVTEEASGPDAPPALPAVETNGTPPLDDAELMTWIEQKRQGQVPWTDIARLVAEQGHPLTEDALRSRHRRWRDKNAQANQT